jgi:hypothetical protein
MVSGQNVWVEGKDLLPRSRLTRVHTNTATSSVGSGNQICGIVTSRPVEGYKQDLYVFSGSTMARLKNDNTVEGGGTWSIMSQTQADSKDIAINDDEIYYGIDVFAANENKSWFIFTNGTDWLGCTDDTQEDSKYIYSYLTGAPNRVKDVLYFDNSPICWGVRESGTADINKVQWPTGSVLTDWTSVGAGSEKLVDMRGHATRGFVQGDEMILASSEEIWRGRKIGGAYRFTFNPISRKLGMPYRHAAINTPSGIFWLARDFMVYHYYGNKITAVGGPILQTLRDDLNTTGGSGGVGDHPPFFFSYDPNQIALTLHYRQVDGPANNVAQAAFTYHIPEQRWTPQMFDFFGTANQGFTPTSDYGYVDMAQAGAGAIGPPPNVEMTTYFGTSTGSVLQYSPTAAADDNTGTTESEFVSGGLFTGDPIHMKWSDKVRLDARADSTSNISVAVSGNLGGTYATEVERAVSVGSQTSQAVVPTGVSGQYHSLRLRSEDTGWRVSRCMVRARVQGEFNG